MKRSSILTSLLPVIAIASFATAHAGSIILTGHDDDLHESNEALLAVSAFTNFVGSGDSNKKPALPILVFDQGTQLSSTLTFLGYSVVAVDPGAGPIDTTLFDHNKYAAFEVASDTTCGGCDNDATGSANLSTPAVKSAIASFFNAGGGIVAFAGASNPSYYDFIPSTVSNPGLVDCPPGDCFTQTAVGAQLGIPAVTTDYPHNFFPFPGSPGMSSAWVATEVFNGKDADGNTLVNQPFTVAIKGSIVCDPSTSGCFITPEPSTWLAMGLGLAIVGFARNKRIRAAVS